MGEKREEVQKEKNEEEKAVNMGITLMFTVIAVIIGFAILLCMQ